MPSAVFVLIDGSREVPSHGTPRSVAPPAEKKLRRSVLVLALALGSGCIVCVGGDGKVCSRDALDDRFQRDRRRGHGGSGLRVRWAGGGRKQ